MAPMYRAVNHDFFKKWTPEMAYVLGYFAADGSMIRNNRGAHFIEFTSIDKSLVLLVRRALSSSHTISVRLARLSTHKISYRIQIGSKEMFTDLKNFGFMQNKSNTIRLPKIPQGYFGDFVRGYFDGDGSVFIDDKKKRLLVVFCCGSYGYLENLSESLAKLAQVKKQRVIKGNRSFQIKYSTLEAIKLYKFMYNTEAALFLERKYQVFQRFIKSFVPMLPKIKPLCRAYVEM